MAKRLKKEKVNVDIVNFGEEVLIFPSFKNQHTLFYFIAVLQDPFCNPQEINTEKLTTFINTLNGKEGVGSHLVTVPPGNSLADALLSSPIFAGEEGAILGLGASDFEFGVDPSSDPELALVNHFIFIFCCCKMFPFSLLVIDSFVKTHVMIHIRPVGHPYLTLF